MTDRRTSVVCPFCGAAADDECRTTFGTERRDVHVTRWRAVNSRLRNESSRWLLLKDDPRFGIAKDDVLIGAPYWLDPDKVTVERRESDGFEPECNQYREHLHWLGWAE